MRLRKPDELEGTILFLALLLLAQWPLITNPGYYSHDELQWAAFAEQGRSFSWLAMDAFQYRPLTFNLWMWLSRHLFEHPYAFHAFIVGWGTLNALLLQRVLRAAGVALFPASAAALLFALGPYAAMVHGWVATIGDLAWVGCALAIAWCALRLRSAFVLAAATAAFTAIALLAKEAAVSIPALAGVALLLDTDRRRWKIVLVSALVPAAVYLGLRLQVLLFTEHQAQGTAYDWRFAALPLRWLEYQIFLPYYRAIETFVTFANGPFKTGVFMAGALWLTLLYVLARIHWRWAAAFVLGGIAALGPVLILDASFNQYGYGFAAVFCGGVALAWQGFRRWERTFVAVYAALVLLHGACVMYAVREVGEIQAVFSPALADVVAREQAPVTLALAPDAQDWVFRRLTHQIPSYRGIEIGDRVRWSEPGHAADYRVERDGHLTPLR